VNQERKQKFYSSPQWRQLRLFYIQEHPVDELCLLNQEVVAADHIHHIIKFENQATEELKWMLLTDVDNLVAVSEETHINIHYRPHQLTDA
jgi:hypothetical protein